MSDITQILSAIEQGDSQASEQLLPLVYDELRRLAAQKMANESPGQTLQATALVHEAYLRLLGPEVDRPWDGRGHFFAAAAEAMRRILIDASRRKQAEKHGGGCQRIDLNDADLATTADPSRLLALDEAVDALAEEDAPAAELVKLRLFGGLSTDEAAGVLNMSHSTAYRHWTYARAWIRARVQDGE